MRRWPARVKWRLRWRGSLPAQKSDTFELQHGGYWPITAVDARQPNVG